MRFSFAIAAMPLIGVLLTGCSGGEEPVGPPASRPVKLFTVEGAGTSALRNFPGSVRATRRADLAFRVSGVLQQMLVREGQTVKEGDMLPAFENRVMTAALNVPVQQGCLLDTNLVLADSTVEAEQINETMRAARAAYEGIVDVVEDPIVSSDVLGNSHSLLFDIQGTIKAGGNMIKTLGWYENLGHAARLLDVARLYAGLDRQEEAA